MSDCFAKADFLDGLHCVIQKVNDPLWYWLVWILVGVGLFFTITTGFVQIRLLGRSIKEMTGSRQNQNDPHGITAFQAFVTGLASRVGTGNIAGVAIAIGTGGAGAVFWMWLTALIGMSSAFAESSLAQLFKVRDPENGQFRGGPAYYIAQGLKQRWLAVLFSLSLILSFGFVFNMIQANTIVQSIQSAAGLTTEKGIAIQTQIQFKWAIALILIAITAPIIFGGIQRISKIAEAMVPLMAILYLVMALYVIFTHLGDLPKVFHLIIDDAFTFKAASGGFLGSLISKSMLLGIKRGLFSNEAGMGSAPNAAAAADVKHPVSQGMIQMLGVFVDTMVVCSCTAFIILLAPIHQGADGVQLTQAALESHVGSWGQTFLAVILFLFCFSTIIGNYAYAESNVQFLKNNRTVVLIFRFLVLGGVLFGALSKSDLVWDMGDLSMGIMALINLVAILALYKLVLLLVKDYSVKLKLGKEPEFKLSEHPVLKRKIKSDIW